MRLSEIALLLDAEVIGGPDINITGVCGLKDAKAGDITYISEKKYLKDALGTSASCIIVKEPLDNAGVIQLKVKDPKSAYVHLLEHFYVKPMAPKGISPLAFVDKNVSLGTDITVYPFVYISEGAALKDRAVLYPGVFVGENSVIGSDVLIYPNVYIGAGVSIGDRAIIHAGASLGADGFGYLSDVKGHRKIPQVGGVIIGEDVEIGANSCIDRATTGNTIIKRGTKIDNLVQIGHNVTIGEDSIVVSQVGIGGSSDIGNRTVFGGQSGTADHVKIEDGTMIAGRGGVIGDLPRGVYSGMPAMPHKDFLRSSAIFQRLPELNKKIKELEASIAELQRRSNL